MVDEPIDVGSARRDPVGRRVAAERDALLELIAIFAHDLSNPLQSVTVLCELALDETVPGTEDHLRTQQCIEAAERMRALVHGLAGLTRRDDGPTSVEAVQGRLATLLARRYDRYHIIVHSDFSLFGGIRPLENIELPLLNLQLGLIASAGEGHGTRHTLALRGALNGDNEDAPVALELEAWRFDGSGGRTPLVPTALYAERVRDGLAMSPHGKLLLEGPVSRLEFAASREA